jgi:hypothetical protein
MRRPAFAVEVDVAEKHYPEPQYEEEEEDSEEIQRQRYRELMVFPELEKIAERIFTAASNPPFVESVGGLREAVGGGNPGERFSALVCRLAGLLSAETLGVRRVAVRLLALGADAGEELEPALPAVLAALHVPDRELRLSLLGILECLAGRRLGPAILPPILEHLFEDDAPQVVAQALAVVMGAGVDLASAAIPQIVGLLTHPNDQVRLSACVALAKFGPEADLAVPGLLRLACSDPSPDLREQAAIALAAVDPEAERLGEELPDRAGRAAFLSLLRVVGPPARELRVRLGKRPLPRISLDHATRTITYDGTRYPGIDKTAFGIFKAIWDSRPAPVSSRVLEKLQGCTGRTSTANSGNSLSLSVRLWMGKATAAMRSCCPRQAQRNLSRSGPRSGQG